MCHRLFKPEDAGGGTVACCPECGRQPLAGSGSHSKAAPAPLDLGSAMPHPQTRVDTDGDGPTQRLAPISDPVTRSRNNPDDEVTVVKKPLPYQDVPPKEPARNRRTRTSGLFRRVEGRPRHRPSSGEDEVTLRFPIPPPDLVATLAAEQERTRAAKDAAVPVNDRSVIEPPAGRVDEMPWVPSLAPPGPPLAAASTAVSAEQKLAEVERLFTTLGPLLWALDQGTVLLEGAGKGPEKESLVRALRLLRRIMDRAHAVVEKG